jgi:hypothetical protein
MAQKQRPAALAAPRAADGSGEDLAADTATPASNSQALRACLRSRHLTERLHALGPRPVGELLIEVAAGRDLLDALEEYSRLEPRTVAVIGARDWPPLPLARVA